MRGFYLMAITICCAIGIGVGALSATGSTTVGATPNVVGTSISDTLAQQSALVSIAASVSGLSRGELFSLSGSGDVDFMAQASMMSFTYEEPPLSPLELVVNTLFVDRRLYIGSPLLAQFTHDKTWIEIPRTDNGLRRADSSVNPLRTFEMLQGGETLTRIGSTTINGVPVSGYSITFTGRGHIANRALGLLSELPSPISSALSPVVRATIDKTETNLDFYVDQNDLIKRVAEHVVVRLPDAKHVVISVALNLSSFGVRFAPKPPPSSMVAPLLQLKGLPKSARSGALGI